MNAYREEFPQHDARVYVLSDGSKVLNCKRCGVALGILVGSLETVVSTANYYDLNNCVPSHLQTAHSGRCTINAACVRTTDHNAEGCEIGASARKEKSRCANVQPLNNFEGLARCPRPAQVEVQFRAGKVAAYCLHCLPSVAALMESFNGVNGQIISRRSV